MARFMPAQNPPLFEPAAPAHPVWRWPRPGPEISSEGLILLASLAFAALYNNALWHLLFSHRPLAGFRDLALAGSLFVVVTAVQFAGLALLLHRAILRPVLALLFLCTAAASFFMDRYAVMLNTEMLQNILQTDPAEASELLTGSLAVQLTCFGLLPAVLLMLVQVGWRPWRRALAVRAAAVVGALLVAGVAVLWQYQPAASLVRGHRDARHLVTPTNYLVSLYRLGRHRVEQPPGPRLVVAADAHQRAVAAGRRPRLLVLAIGETARSANFGLSGYVRDTTPELRRLDPVVFPAVAACGTSTEVALPCMFSAVGRRDYDEDRIRQEESLLHVLDRAGVGVLWIDNQSGCKGVCTDLPAVRLGGTADPAFCDGERCLDEILLPQLQQAIGQAGDSQKDLVVVLHLLGSHGPAYSHRYPPAFRHYRPTCENADLGSCTREEIVNAYDNTIRYTDHVLAALIKELPGVTNRDAALLYVSDHGESLGENGFYLHGLPYRLAPAVQKEVPMVLWLSPDFTREAHLDSACLRRRSAAPTTHDNLFHSVLGLMDVATRVRDASLDVFSGCRTTSVATGLT
jgi:lipid A ethanolaminephosphotransferase